MEFLLKWIWKFWIGDFPLIGLKEVLFGLVFLFLEVICVFKLYVDLTPCFNEISRDLILLILDFLALDEKGRLWFLLLYILFG